jgi:hypothetical protein
MLTNYVGKLSPEKLHLLGKALKIALQLDGDLGDGIWGELA